MSIRLRQAAESAEADVSRAYGPSYRGQPRLRPYGIVSCAAATGPSGALRSGSYFARTMRSLLAMADARVQ